MPTESFSTTKDDELRTFATDLKKPTLEYPGEQSYIEAYSDFFDKIIE